MKTLKDAKVGETVRVKKLYGSARVLPSGQLDLMSISIKKLASVSAALAGIAYCWRVLNL